jgi:sugar lactone lactonase YvrE
LSDAGGGSKIIFQLHLRVMFYMRIVTSVIFTLILSFSAHAEMEGSFTSGLSKVELVQELSIAGMRKVLGWSGGNVYFAKKDGSVGVISKEGKEIFTLQAKISKDDPVLKQPEAVAVTESMIYVVDSKTDRVAMFNLQGKYQGSLGIKSSGGFFSGKGNSLNSPHGIAVRNGVLYVTDTSNGRIQLFGSNGVFLATLEIDSAPENIATKEKQPYKLHEPTDIALDAGGRIYVLDADDAWVKIYSSTGTYLNHLPVKAIAFSVAPDGIYVAERDSYAINKYDFSGKQISSFGSKGKGRAQFKSITGLVTASNSGLPSDIATELSHQVLIGDSEKGIADVFTVEAGTIFDPEVRLPARTAVRWEQTIPVSVGKMAWNGKETIYGVDSENNTILRIVNGKVVGEIKIKDFYPASVAIDRSGALWALDKKKSRVVKLSETGNIIASFGSSGSHKGELDDAEDFAISSNGVVFVADRGNHRVQAFSNDGVFLKEIRSDAAGKLEDPTAIVIDSQDVIYVLDKGRSIISIYSAKTEPLGIFGKSAGSVPLLTKPLAMMVTLDELFVLDSNQVKVFTHTGKYVRFFATVGNGVGELDEPIAILATGDTTFAIAERGNKRVQTFTTLYQPTAPERVVTQPGVHAIELHWATPALPYVKQYRIYRSPAENSGFIEIATSASTQYTDTGLEADKKFFYRVAGETPYGFVGPKSETVTGTTSKFIPPPLEKVMVESSQGQVKITWKPVDPRYFSTFLIYKKDGDTFTKISETTQPEFTKNSLTPNTAYTYYLSTLSTDGTESEKLSVTATTPPSNRAPLEIEVLKLQDVFSNSYKIYEQDGVGRIKLTNNTDKPIEKIKVSFMLNNFMDFPTEGMIDKLLPGQSEEVILKAVFNNNILTISEDSSIQAMIEASYFQDGTRQAYSKNATVTIYDKHRMTWDEHERFASFVTPKDTPIINFARSVATQFKDTKDESQLAAALFDSMGVMGFTYIQSPSDPYQISLAKTATTAKTDTVDYVQYPRETLERKSGDCVDLVAFYSTSLESMGITTLALEVPDHLLMMFSTGINADADGYTMNDMYVIHDGMLWIPVEATVVGKPFIKAWELGAANYYKWKGKGLAILDVHNAWNTFKPATLPNSSLKAMDITPDAIEKKFPGDFISMLKISSQTKTRRYLQAIQKNPGDMDAHLQMGIILAKIGDREEAMKYFDKVLSADPKNAAALNNRGNIFMLKEKYPEAQKAYLAASQVDSRDAYIWVNLAKSYKAVNDTKKAKAAFIKAQKLDMTVKEKYKALALELLNSL